MSLTIKDRHNYLNYPNNTTSITNTSNTTDDNSITSQAKSSQNSTQTNDSHLNLNTGTVQFVMKNGLAESAHVDGIKMNLSDMFLRDKNQLKARINEECNKTDTERLEEIFGL